MSIAREDLGTTNVEGDDDGVDAAAETTRRAKTRAPLDEAALEGLVTQLEFYFGDGNAATDRWLRERIASDPEGWVSLADVCAFPRMRNKLKKRDWRDEAPRAVRTSSSAIIEVSECGERIRRLGNAPVPEVDLEEVQARTVVVENCKEWTVAALRETFEPCGKVVNVSVRKPGRDGVPATENRGKTHALVEFETPNEAKEAVSRLDNPADWRNGLRVRIQLKQGQKKKKKQVAKPPADEQASEEIEGEEKDCENDNQGEDQGAKKSQKKKKKKPDYAKWASAAAFKENRTAITTPADGMGEGASEEALEEALPKRLVLTPRTAPADARQPSMPDGSPGFNRVRTCTPKFVVDSTTGSEETS